MAWAGTSWTATAASTDSEPHPRPPASLTGRDGTLPIGSTRILAQTGPFDHCNMTVAPGAPARLTVRFKDLLLGMSYGDPIVRPLLDLEGLKAWCAGRTTGYGPLEGAVDVAGFYDPDGGVTAHDYRP